MRIVKRLCYCVVVSAVTGLPSHAHVGFRTVIVTGDAAPGSGGATFDNIGIPTINNLGQVAFEGRIYGEGVTTGLDNAGVWSEVSGQLTLVVGEGDTASGLSDSVFQDFLYSDGVVHIDDNGHILITAEVFDQGTGQVREGFWTDAPGVTEPIMLDGMLAPEIPGYSYTGVGLGYPSLSLSGHVAFLSRVETAAPGPSFSAIWAGLPGNLLLVAQEGGVAPATNGSTFDRFLPGQRLLVNPHGMVVFNARLQGQDTDTNTDSGIWCRDSGELFLVAREGDAMPGHQGLYYGGIGNASVNAAGQIVYTSGVSGSGINDPYTRIIWRYQDGVYEALVNAGDAVPGISETTIKSIFETRLSASGSVVFKARLEGASITESNEIALIISDGNSLSLIAREGDLAPGAGNAMFEDIASFSPTVNAIDQVAFSASLTGDFIDNSNDRGVWATRPNGELILVVREGETFDIDDSPHSEDLRVVSRVFMQEESGGEDGLRIGLNNLGQLLLTLRFTDGSEGFFVATISDGIDGDATGDGLVGVEDLDLLLANWGDSVGIRNISAGDLSGDGYVGQEDLDILIANWGSGDLPGVLIPEPVSALWFASLGLVGRRRTVRSKNACV